MNEEFETEYGALSTQELIEFASLSGRTALEQELAHRLSLAEAAIAAARALCPSPFGDS